MGDSLRQLQQMQAQQYGQSQPPQWLTSMATNPMPNVGGLMAAPGASPMGGLMDFNALAMQLAGPAPQPPQGGGSSSMVPLSLFNAPVTAGNAMSAIRAGVNVPYTPHSVPGMFQNQSGFDLEAEAMSRRGGR